MLGPATAVHDPNANLTHLAPQLNSTEMPMSVAFVALISITGIDVSDVAWDMAPGSSHCL